MKKLLLNVMLLVVLSMSAGCLYVARYDGPYLGKVVDQETREPIEGVVVLGTWSVYHFSVAGGYSTYHDARETVTDKNGDFVVPGEGLRILSSLQPMRFTIFKAGYKYYESDWAVLKTDIPIKEEERVKWNGDVPVFPLKKLTLEERKRQGGPPIEVPEKKMKLMLKELNKDRVDLGLDVIHFER